jgi:hypothetical protein
MSHDNFDNNKKLYDNAMWENEIEIFKGSRNGLKIDFFEANSEDIFYGPK